MQLNYCYLMGFIILLYVMNTSAEITLDGSWGRNDALIGPQFDISAELGKQVGNNLFHSFTHFNLHVGDTATFSGPEHIEHIISRVTGGTPSTLEGTLRATIPQADMYFINPAGIILGEQARLEVPGAIHLSTADVLQLGEGGQFAATHPHTSSLTTAAPTAFGFLSDTPQAIQVQGSQLSVAKYQAISISGGNLEFKQSQLQAEEGKVNLISIASPGTVLLSANELKPDNTDQLGHLTLEDTQLDVSGTGAGSIFIHAGQVDLNRSKLSGNPQGDKAGGIIHIKATDLIMKDTDISSSTNSAGRGGEVVLDIAKVVTISGYLYGIFSSARSEQTPAGDAGKITITAKDLYLTEGAQISSSSFGHGQGGEIDIQASDAIILSDFAFISVNSQGIGEQAGDAGKIILTTHDLSLAQGAQIGSVTFGDGQGGAIIINASGTVTVDGYAPGDEFSPIYQSAINVSADIGSSGNAGVIDLTARQLNIKDGGAIGSTTYGAGQGDNITLNVAESVNISGAAKVNVDGTEQSFASQVEAASQEGANQAGHVVIKTPLLILTDGGKVTTSAKTAEAGQIDLQVAQLQLDNQAAIISESAGTGEAGSINVNAADKININNAKISTEAAQAAGGHITITVPHLLSLQKDGTITTSVQGGSGGGGDITITKPTFVLLNHATIRADAHGGNGGNITIEADQYLRSADSSVTASSKLGTPGEIEITALNADISGTLVILPATFLDASALLKSPCDARSTAKQSHFVIKRLTGSPPSPYDWKSTRLLLLAEPTTTSQPSGNETTSSFSLPVTVLAMTCQDSSSSMEYSKQNVISEQIASTQLF